MDREIMMVREFLEKHEMHKLPDVMKQDHLALAAARLELVGKQLLEDDHSPHAVRAALLIEELSEYISAYANRDRVEELDALCDLIYVALGQAVVFNLPITAAFAEVHRSNMSKRRRCEHEDTRIRDKGPDYTPPRLKELL